jgi:hypothetical protein
MATRCPTCQAAYDQAQDQQRPPRPHYAGDYRKRAKIVRDNAVACWICGGGYRDADPWQADHVEQGEVTSLLLPAHRSCNIVRSNQRFIKK